jgi:hypothetical protein
MTMWRVTFLYGAGANGASETWVSPAGDAPSTLPLINSLIAARQAFMPADMYWQGTRISLYPDPALNFNLLRQSILIPPGSVRWPAGAGAIKASQNGNFTTGSQTGVYEDIFKVSLQLQVGFASGRITNRYLSGVPENISVGFSGGYNAAALGNFDSLLSAWIGVITANKWGIGALDRTATNPPYYVSAVVNKPAGVPLLGIIFLTAAVPNWPPGTTMQLQGFRSPKGIRGATINGKWVLDSISQTDDPRGSVFYLRGSSLVLANQVAWTPKTHVYKWAPVVYPVDYITALKSTEHKRGRPTTASRGRASKRVTLGG